MVRASTKMTVWLLCMLIFDIQWRKTHFIPFDLDLNFQDQTFKILIRGKRKELAQNIHFDFCAG